MNRKINSDEIFIYGYKIPKQLTKQEVYELLVKSKQGDKYAKTKLIEHNIRLVIYEVTSRFNNVEYEKKDLVSIGNIGLIKAVTTFDISKKVEFSTYAIRCIDNEILLFLRKLNKDKNVDSLNKTISYDKDGNELKLEDILIDDTDVVEQYTTNETYCIVRQIVNELPEFDRKVIMLNFGFYNDKIYTQKEIANILSVHPSKISRLIPKIIRRLNKELKQKGIIEISTQEILKSEIKNKKELKNKKIESISNNTSGNIKEKAREENTIIDELVKPKTDDKSSTSFSEEFKTKEEYIKILELLRTPTFTKMMNIYSLKETMIISLKLGYIDGKCFSNAKISEFLGIEEQEVARISRQILLSYKKAINNVVDDAIQILTEEPEKTYLSITKSLKK